MSTELAIAALAVVSVALWIAALAMKRVDRSDAVAGIRNGVVIALVIGLLAGALAYVVLADAAAREQAALSVGLWVGLGFLLLGLAIMPIGFIAKGGRDWARYGTWAAVAIAVISLGMGWTMYTAFEEQRAPRPTPGGHVTQRDTSGIAEA